MVFLQILTYACVAIGVAAIAVRAVRYASTPIHLRWELYPVPHERGRGHYGGSIFEVMEWWTKPRDCDHVSELREMAEEIILLKGVREHNPALWRYTFPFHFGLYLLSAWVLLLVLVSILAALGVSTGGGLFAVLKVPVAILGYAGLGLTAFGAAGLLKRRLGDAEIRRYSVPAEFFNLGFLLVTTLVVLAAHLAYDPWFGQLVAFGATLVGFKSAAVLSPPLAVGVGIALGALVIAYIPLSRMAHFVAKYFLYHQVRWSDEPNPRGGAIESQLKRAFGLKMGWRAPHIQTGKSWAEVGTELKEKDA